VVKAVGCKPTGFPVISSNLIRLILDYLQKSITNTTYFINFYFIKNLFFIFYFILIDKDIFIKNVNKKYFPLLLKINNFNNSNFNNRAVYTDSNVFVKLLNFFILNFGFYDGYVKKYPSSLITSVIYNKIDVSFTKRLKVLFNFLYNYNLYNYNFLILNTEYTYIQPFYKYKYSENFLSNYKKYFFIKPNRFTYKSQLYFYVKFCNMNNTNLLILLDYDHYLIFIKNILEVDFCIIGLVPFNIKGDYIDYPIYVNHINNFSKLLYSSLIFQTYFTSLSYKNYLFQQKYLHYFSKFCKLL
jgi:hypothetical protein